MQDEKFYPTKRSYRSYSCYIIPSTHIRVEGFGRNTAGECAFTMWKRQVADLKNRLCLWNNYFCKPPFNRTCKGYSTDFTFSSNNKSHAILSNLILIIQIWLNRSIYKHSFHWHWHLVTWTLDTCGISLCWQSKEPSKVITAPITVDLWYMLG